MAGKYQAYSECKDSGVEWLGDMPKHWELSPLKHLARFSGGGTPSKDNPEFWRGDIPWVSPKDMKSPRITSTIDNVTEMAIDQSSTNLLKEGALLMVVRSGILQHSIPVAINDVPVTLNQDMKALRFNTRLNVQYAMGVITGNQKVLLLEWAKQGATVESIEQEYLANTSFPVPPVDEQQKIANFLDHETAKIDTLIEKQQQLIKLLKEKRQAVISHAVTKGLNPNAPMRDSGVEWLGEVPEHWKVNRFKFLCDRIIAGPFGSSITKDMYVRRGYKVYGQEQVIPNDFSIGDYYISEKDFNELSRYMVSSGDILISCVGTFGKIAVFPEGAEQGIINPRLIKAVINSNCNPYYIREMLKSEVVFKQFELLSRGGTMGVINIAILNEILAAVPPSNEQSEIVTFINKQKFKFGKLIERANHAVWLLKERRTALISAAVTGKIDVRNWQAPQQKQSKREAAA